MISICNSLYYSSVCVCSLALSSSLLFDVYFGVCSRFTIKTKFRSQVYFNFSEAIKIKIYELRR